MKRWQSIQTTLIAALVAAVVAGGVQTLFSARAAQDELVPPTSGSYTGVQFSQLLGDAFRSLASCNKGSSAPANVGGAPVDGQCWIDDSVSPWLYKIHADGSWLTAFALDDANAIAVGSLGGGTTTLASASTTNLGSVPQANITVTGTTTITSFGSSAPTGAIKVIRFEDVLTLTHASSLKVPGSYSIATAADDRAIVTHLGSGNWEVTQYTRASGIPLDVSAVGGVRHTNADAPSALEVYGVGQALTRTSYPAYLAKVTRAQNGTRTSGNATIDSVADTKGLGAGMPVEGAGINAGCTIASVTSSTIVLNSAGCVTSSGTATVTVFPLGYGSGGSAATVGVVDCQARMIAGRDAPTGSATSRITNAGSGVDSSIRNAGGGAQTVTLARANLPNDAVNVDIASGQGLHGHNTNTNRAGANDVGGNSFGGGGVSQGNHTTLIVNNTLPAMTGTFGLNGSVTQTVVNKLPPIVTADCVVRVLP